MEHAATLPKVESQYLVDMRQALVETTAGADAIITHPLLEDVRRRSEQRAESP